jgi:hypothetical protein
MAQLVTQMGDDKDYDSVASIALNLEQAISIADAALPPVMDINI